MKQRPPPESFSGTAGLSDWIPSFLKERIDLDALMLLTESDLGNIHIHFYSHLLIHASIHPPILSFISLVVHFPFINIYIYLLIHSFIPPFIRSSGYPFIFYETNSCINIA